MRFSKFDVCCFFFVLFSPLQVAKFKVTAADNQTAFLHAICIFLCLSVCLSVSLLATVLQFKSLFILLSSRQDENGKNHFHSRFELFGAENICSRRGAEFSCIFRVCRWMLFPSFYTTAGHNCPPSHAHHPQTTKASNFICGRNCFGPYDPPSRPALAHCSSDALSALATWQIESKMQQPLFLVPFAGLDFPLFCSTFSSAAKQNQCNQSCRRRFLLMTSLPVRWESVHQVSLVVYHISLLVATSTF